MKSLFPLLLTLVLMPVAQAGRSHHADKDLVIIYRDHYRPYWHPYYRRPHVYRCYYACVPPRFHRRPHYDIRLRFRF